MGGGSSTSVQVVSIALSFFSPSSPFPPLGAIRSDLNWPPDVGAFQVRANKGSIPECPHPYRGGRMKYALPSYRVQYRTLYTQFVARGRVPTVRTLSIYINGSRDRGGSAKRPDFNDHRRHRHIHRREAERRSTLWERERESGGRSGTCSK